MPDVRLIDASALKGQAVEVEIVTPPHNHYCSELVVFGYDIDEAPTIDAVPVVRCRECEKFWEYTESHKATVEKADGDCMIRCMVAPDDPQFCAVQKEDYCSMGKRKGAKMDGGAE